MPEKQRKEAVADASSDPLGKPLATYTARKSATLLFVAAAILGLAGACVRGASGRLAQSLADSPDDKPYALVGWGLMIAGSVAVAAAILQLGKKFEIRRKGVRFSRRGSPQELRWDEIQDIQVRKKKVVYRGRPIRTLWEVDLVGDDDTIALGSAFLGQISSVTELINLLKRCSGKEIDLPPLY